MAHEVRIVAQIVTVDRFGGSKVVAERTAITIPADALPATALVDIVRAVRSLIDVDAVVAKVNP